MARTFKKTLALILAVILAVSLTGGFSVFAEDDDTQEFAHPVYLEMGGETTTYATLDEAVAAFKAADTADDGHITFDPAYSPFESGSIVVTGKSLTIGGAAQPPDAVMAFSVLPIVINMENEVIQIIDGTLTFEGVNVNMTNTVDKGFNVIVGKNSVVSNSHLVFKNSVLDMDGSNSTARGIGHQGAKDSNTTTSFTNSIVSVCNYKTNGFFTEKEANNTLNVTNSVVSFNYNGAGLITGAGAGTAVNINASTFDVLKNGGNGSNGGHWTITSDSQVDFSGNGSHGLSAQTLKVSGSTLSANENGANGIHVTVKLEVVDSAINVKNNTVGIASQWTKPGALYLADGANTVTKSILTLTGNQGPALHLNAGSLTIDQASDVTIRDNRSEDPSENPSEAFAPYRRGAGVYVGGGTLTLPWEAQIYNNRASTEADDLYVAEGASITFGPAYPAILNEAPKFEVGHEIDGWYDDNSESRWQAHAEDEADNYIAEFTGYTEATVGPLTLKAAHGIIQDDVTASFIVKKVNASGSPITGNSAEFTLYNSDNVALGTYVTSTQDATVEITGLTDGVYTLKETKAPSGYQSVSTVWTITVVEGGNVPYRVSAQTVYYIDSVTASPGSANWNGETNTLTVANTRSDDGWTPSTPTPTPPTTDIPETTPPLGPIEETPPPDATDPVEDIKDPEVPKDASPKTGDSSSLALLWAVLGLSSAGISATVLGAKRGKKRGQAEGK